MRHIAIGRILAALAMVALATAYAVPASAAPITLEFSQTTGFRASTSPGTESGTVLDLGGGPAVAGHGGLEFHLAVTAPPGPPLGDGSAPPDIWQSVAWGCGLFFVNCANGGVIGNGTGAADPFGNPDRSALRIEGQFGFLTSDTTGGFHNDGWVDITLVTHQNHVISGNVLSTVKIDSILRLGPSGTIVDDPSPSVVNVAFTETVNFTPPSSCTVDPVSGAPVNPFGSECDDFFIVTGLDLSSIFIPAGTFGTNPDMFIDFRLDPRLDALICDGSPGQDARCGSYAGPAIILYTPESADHALAVQAHLRVVPQCPEDPNRAALLTRTVNRSEPDLSGNGVPGSPKNYWTVQAAYDAAKGSAQAEVIGLFANTNENLVLDGSKSLTITQCTVARVTGAAGSPVWNITSTGKLTIVGPDSVGGSIGWRVAGNGGHTLKSIRANGATQYGVLVVSNGNSVGWNDVSGNGTTISDAGIRAEGSSNTLKGGTVSSNKGDGVQLIGNSNTLSGSTIASNTGNGVLVAGSTNKVDSNSRINQNALNGILVTGSTNTVSSNTSESSKGNTQNGIKVASGTGNQLTSNKMNSNLQAGFYIAASTGTKVKSNATSNNTGNEYTIGAGNTDQGGNKKNGSSFTFASGGGNFN